MWILIDHRLPAEAKDSLSNHGTLVEFRTKGITYDAVSGHPDIFFCRIPGGYVVAPNTPQFYFSFLNEHRIPYMTGKMPVGNTYPGTAGYNAVVFDSTIIHHRAFTDPAIPAILGSINDGTAVQYMSVKQGYTRCNLVHLSGKHFLTSDKGIEGILIDQGYSTLFVEPEGIILPGFDHGFFGGCCGVYQNRLFISGSLDCLRDGDKVRKFLKNADFEIVELYQGPLFDGGSILFLE
jgi:hypothetical protein